MTLRVDVTGDGGRPLAGANVNLVTLHASGLDIGGGLAATGYTTGGDVTTDAGGTALFAVFPGSRRGFGSRGITVTGPAGTSYCHRETAVPDDRRRHDGRGAAAETGAGDRLRAGASADRRQRLVGGRQRRGRRDG